MGWVVVVCGRFLMEICVGRVLLMLCRKMELLNGSLNFV